MQTIVLIALAVIAVFAFYAGYLPLTKQAHAQTMTDQQCENGVCVAPAEGKAEPSVKVNNAKVSKYASETGQAPVVDRTVCKDRHEGCKQFGRQGECTKNPGWMIVNCANTCNACHLRDASVRCQRSFLNISDEPAFQPGGLNKMFQHIADNAAEYQATVHSTSPWVVTFDNFFSDEEANALLSTASGNNQNWERSTDTGLANEFGETGRVLSKGRTSSNAWCRKGCEDNAAVKRITHRIEEVTGVSFRNSESYQVLKYELGQKYNAHHDSSLGQVKLTCGPRILTFFLYLSDVEEGGETAFPSLNIVVKPKKGRALLWPSVLDSDPTMIDGRTIHEARTVIKGTKFAANSWIHLYNFEKSNLWGCTGTFD